MNARSIWLVLVLCVGLLVISAVVRAELYVIESLLPLFELNGVVVVAAVE